MGSFPTFAKWYAWATRTIFQRRFGLFSAGIGTGVFYLASLGFVGGALTAAGDGTYFFLVLAFSPFLLTPTQVLALLAWPLAWAFALSGRTYRSRWGVVAFLALHYSALLSLLVLPSPFGDSSSDLQRAVTLAPGTVATASSIYLANHVALWLVLWYRRRHPRT